ncbi:Uncharacterised protein [Brucella neotomae]|nr:Uncharacterised protein [Brucella neotomae]
MAHVENEETKAGGDKRQRLQAQPVFADVEADNGEPEEGGCTCRSCKPVHAVAHIDRIDKADDEGHGEKQ